MTVTVADLDQKREALARRLQVVQTPPAEVVDLVRKADAAVAKMKEQTAAVEAELAEVDAVLDVRERDRREAAARQRREQRAAKEAALLGEHEARLQAVADAESAARAFADAVKRAIESNARMSTLASELDAGGKAPIGLNPIDLVTRLANRLAATLSTIPGHRYRLGRNLEWPAGIVGNDLYRPDADWRAYEDRRVAELIDPLTKGA
jgi:hypothetical protein